MGNMAPRFLQSGCHSCHPTNSVKPSKETRNTHPASGLVSSYNNNNNIHICIAPYGRNFRGAGPGSVLVGVRRGKRVSLGEEKCL